MEPIKSILWQGGELSLWEVCRLYQSDEENRLTGTVVGKLDGQLLEARYDVKCTRHWHTKEVSVELRQESNTLNRSFRVEPTGQWIELEGKDDLRHLQGIIDIDIQISPSTNTLPIKRLNLRIGASARVTAAWLKFPDLQVERQEQRYTRVADKRYAFESGGGQFRAEIEVDDFGLVRKYGNFWRAI